VTPASQTQASPRPPGPLSPVGLVIVIGVLILDQLAKLAAEHWLALGEAIDVLPILALYRTYNTGIAFSLFAGFGATGLIVGTLAITVLVAIFWARSRDGGMAAALGFALIVGGALGNLIDRLVHGHVIDFLLLHFGSRTLFVFNLADVALTFGPLILLFAFMRPAPRSA
jgi:signal peptidase II